MPSPTHRQRRNLGTIRAIPDTCRAGVPAPGGSLPQYDNRTVLEAVLWIARTGSPWRDLPPEFGKWNTIYRRCHRRCQKGVFGVFDDDWFAQLSADLEPELETVMVDGTLVKVHQHGTGTPKADAVPS